MTVSKLTASHIAGARPASEREGRYYVLERGGRGAVDGFGVAIGRRLRYYVVRFRRKAVPVPGGRCDAGMLVEDARAIAREMLQRLMGGEELSVDRPLRELRAAYMKRHAAHKPRKSAADDERMWDVHILPFVLEDGRQLGDVGVRQASADHLSQLHVALGGAIGSPAPTDRPYLANRALALLCCAFNLAVTWRWRKAEQPNPARGIRRYPEHTKRSRHYSELEYAAWGAAISAAYEAIAAGESRLAVATVACCELLVYCGGRPGEVSALRWEWLEATRQKPGILFTNHSEDSWSGRFRLPAAKGDRAGDDEAGRDLWLNAPAFAVLRRMALLQRWQGDGFPPSGPVFQSPLRGHGGERSISTVKHCWKILAAAAGISDATPKTLRHSFVSEGTAAGVARELMQDLAGHSSPTITDGVYRARDDEQQRAAAEAMGAHLARKMGAAA